MYPMTQNYMPFNSDPNTLMLFNNYIGSPMGGYSGFNMFGGSGSGSFGGGMPGITAGFPGVGTSSGGGMDMMTLFTMLVSMFNSDDKDVDGDDSDVDEDDNDVDKSDDDDTSKKTDPNAQEKQISAGRLTNLYNGTIRA